MRIEVIPVKKLGKYMELHRREQELKVTLTNYLEDQRRQLKRLERIKKIANYLANYKKKYKSFFDSMPEEVKKEINKAGGRW
jgi:hypothetical protein